jgi:hypothetical protein
MQNQLLRMEFACHVARGEKLSVGSERQKETPPLLCAKAINSNLQLAARDVQHALYESHCGPQPINKQSDIRTYLKTRRVASPIFAYLIVCGAGAEGAHFSPANLILSSAEKLLCVERPSERDRLRCNLAPLIFFSGGGALACAVSLSLVIEANYYSCGVVRAACGSIEFIAARLSVRLSLNYETQCSSRLSPSVAQLCT